jgi:hypothetical protein
LVISNDFERDFLPLVEAGHSRALDRADVHENIPTTIIRLDESVAFYAVEPLHYALSHLTCLSSSFPRGRYSPNGRNLGTSQARVKHVHPLAADGTRKQRASHSGLVRGNWPSAYAFCPARAEAELAHVNYQKPPTGLILAAGMLLPGHVLAARR